VIEPRLFACSGAKLENGDPLLSGRKVVELDAVGDQANVHIRFQNVAKVFHRHLSARLVDLLEIASYVYSADCSTSRGTEWSDDDASEPWTRDFAFVIPVRQPEFWNSNDVKCSITQALAFLSNDRYSFRFSKLERDRTYEQQYLEFGQDEDWPFHRPDRVIMFSGGLDSLAGAVETARKGGNIALVSHRSVSTLDSRQKKLFAELAKEFPAQLVHIPVWINKDGRFGRESTQRTRSFLYSALGAVVAESLQAGGVRFFENGIVSLNFPVADEALRARASRTTHPIALHMFGELYSAVLGRSLTVDNPYLYKTKTDVVSGLAKHKAEHLIGHTCSCAHSMFKSKTQWHCGTCSQCIDRRFAIAAAGLLAFDAGSDYTSDVFTGPRKEGYEKSMAVDYVRHATELDALSEREFAGRFNTELVRAVRYETRRSEAAEELIEMHKRHGRTVKEVLQREIAHHAGSILDGTIEDTSLLASVVGRKHLDPIWTRYCSRLTGILQAGVPVACSSKKPDNEPHLQEICDGILKGSGHDLVREFPYMRWSSSLTKPDWYVERLGVLIEAKYIRRKTDLRSISEDIAADITKYGDNRFRVLFVVYDPQHIISSDAAFSAPIQARKNMRMAFIR
jgi:7-cyano-7-deazaguanine synthase in queuosine biosynthesis